MFGIDPQKGRTYAALTDSGLVVAAEAEAVSNETGGRIRLKSGCPAWQRRVSRKVEGWESGDGEVSIMSWLENFVFVAKIIRTWKWE